MVIFGGLELVAAGVILHKYNKGKEQEKEQERRSRERRHDRKHHRRRESPPQHVRNENDLYPPQGHPHRAQSAPPPGYAPSGQPQPTYYPPQSWQPQQYEKTPTWNPQLNHYPPAWQAQPQPHPQAYLYPQSQSYGHPQPAQPQPQQTMQPTPHHDDAAFSEILQRGPSDVGSQSTARPQPRPAAIAPPNPDCAELSGDHAKTHGSNPIASPHVTFAFPGDEPRNDHDNEPPPAYEEPRL